MLDRGSFVLPAGAALSGELTLSPTDGPFGIREYERPHYIAATFDFTSGGQNLRYAGLITQWDLWAPTGTQVQTDLQSFGDQIGRIDGMIDDRDDWSYVRPDGTMHTIRLKYTSCHFWVMARLTTMRVKCHYYDTSVCGMVAIFYEAPLSRLLLLPTVKLFHDAAGSLEDFDPHGEKIMRLEER